MAQKKVVRAKGSRGPEVEGLKETLEMRTARLKKLAPEPRPHQVHADGIIRRAFISQAAFVSMAFSAIELFRIRNNKNEGKLDHLETFGWLFGHRDFNHEQENLYIEHAIPKIVVHERKEASVRPYETEWEELRHDLLTLQNPVLNSTLFSNYHFGYFHSHPNFGSPTPSADDQKLARPGEVHIIIGVFDPLKKYPSKHKAWRSPWLVKRGELSGILDSYGIRLGVFYRGSKEFTQYTPICQAMLGGHAYWRV